jgi:hypothetical protein
MLGCRGEINRAEGEFRNPSLSDKFHNLLGLFVTSANTFS